MKWILKIWMLFLPATICNAQTVTLMEVRNFYQQAAVNHEACSNLISRLSNKTDLPESVHLGYKGSATMMKARYGLNPFTKLSNFINGKKMLEKAISMDTNNAELRYLRFTIQTNAPSFLGYRSNLNTDKKFLVASLHKIEDATLKSIIENYISTNH